MVYEKHLAATNQLYALLKGKSVIRDSLKAKSI